MSGETEADLETAFDEAIRRIASGNSRGWDRNDSGAFSFSVCETRGQEPEADDDPHGHPRV